MTVTSEEKGMTFEQALTKIGVTVPGHLEAQAEVPVLTGVQRQGDLLIVPCEGAQGLSRVPMEGIQVVHGEATGNTHWLHNGFGSTVYWGFADSFRDHPVIGRLRVPEGQTAMLIHTDEHGANGIGPGTYEIRQRRQVTESGSWGYSGD